MRASAYDAAVDLEQACSSCASAFTPIAEELAGDEPHDEEWRATYGSLQNRARSSLRAHPATQNPELDLSVPSEAATTWWCAQCGAIDAPQPCLGICVWRPVEWVGKGLYDRQRERALAEQDRERALRRLMRRVASVTPHASQWRRNWQALHKEAQKALGGTRSGQHGPAGRRALQK